MNSDFILIFFSQNSVAKRGYVQREMKLALEAWAEIPEGQIHTIPVRLDACTIPEQFRRFQWVNSFDERGFERIVQAIQTDLSKRKQAGPRAPVNIPIEPVKDLTDKPQQDLAQYKQNGQSSTESSTVKKSPESGQRWWRKPSIIAAIIIAIAVAIGAITQSDLLSSLVSNHRGALPPTMTTNDGAEMILVPAGKFTMGSNTQDAEDDEKPAHRVHLDAFYIDTYEVTNAQYERFIKASNWRVPYVEAEWAWSYNWDQLKQTFPGGKERYPVTFVEWGDAQTYCAWAQKRLPTEAEWEKAARGTDGRKYPWGNVADPSKANTSSGRASAASSRELVEIGSYPEGRSPYGLHDMAGNVWEWVADWYSEEYYRNSPYKNPKGSSEGIYRTLRGGSWKYSIAYARTSNRAWFDPTRRDIKFTGFRCAMSASSSF